MMKLNSLIFILAVLLSVGCKSTGTVTGVQEPPFNVVRATYNHWVGGQPGTKGIQVKIMIDNPSIQLDSIYFRQQKMALSKEVNTIVENTNHVLFIANYKVPNVKKDMYLSSNPLDEYGNEPPPLILDNKRIDSKNEKAIINYRHKGKVHFLTIEKLKRTSTVMMY